MKLIPTPPPPDWRKLKCDPICMVFQQISLDESTQLLASMRRGYDTTQPIVLWNGKILDGRHRLSTAIVSGMIPTFVAFEGTSDEAVDFVWARHAGRRSMSDDAKVQVLIDLESFRMHPNHRPSANGTQTESCQDKSATVAGLSKPVRTIEEVAASARVSPRRVERALNVRRTCDRSEIDSIIRGEKSAFRALADHKKKAEEAKPKARPLPPPPPPPMDAAKRLIHAKAASALREGRERMLEFVKQLRHLKRDLGVLALEPLGRKLRKQAIETDCENLIRQLADATPYTSCPLSADCDEKCGQCQGTQWVTKLQWGGIPADIRGEA